MNPKKLKLMLVQPLLADYRVYFFNKLSKMFEVNLFCDQSDFSTGHDISSPCDFKITNTKTFFLEKAGIYYQGGLIKGFWKFKPDVIFITAHPKNIAFWLLILNAKFYKSRILVHGQGFYNKPNPSLLIKLAYKLMIRLSSRYVCYTQSSLRSMKCLGDYYLMKMVIADNTIFNPHSLPHRTINSNTNGVLFVGRLREGSNFNLLAEAVIKINTKLQLDRQIVLHVVGSGTDFKYLHERYGEYSFINFYGKVYEQNFVTEISRNCFVGCYPGFAGLSVVHHLSLSLPTIVNADLESHMGPEPSYIENGVNGYLFNEYSVGSIQNTLEHVISIKDSEDYSVVCKNAYQTYHNLIAPDFSDKVVDTIEGLF